MKKIRRSTTLLLAFLTLALSCARAHAWTSGSYFVSSRGNGMSRLRNPRGIFWSTGAEPAPSSWGLNFAYNFTWYWRMSAGLGLTKTTDGTQLKTLGAVSRFFITRRSLSPSIGLGMSMVSGLNDYDSATLQLSGLGAKGSLKNVKNGLAAYASAGVDWQSPGGINIGLGYNLFIYRIQGGYPYLSLGIFF